MKKSCSNCYFAEQCRAKKPCVYYTPVDKDHEDLLIKEESDNELKKFKKEWDMYEKRDYRD